MRDIEEYYSEMPLAELTALARISSQLGFEVVDVAGFLDQTEAHSKEQRNAVSQLTQNSGQITQANSRMAESIRTLSQTAEETLVTVSTSASSMRENSVESQKIAKWVQTLAVRTKHIEETLVAMQRDNAQITSIASQVNILAINAKIEAGRAGAAGRGFAVVAEAINELSKRTGTAAADISDNIDTMGDWLKNLSVEARDIGQSADEVLTQSQSIDDSLADIEEHAQTVQKQTNRIASESDTAQFALEGFGEGLALIDTTSSQSLQGIQTARARSDSLIDSSEALLQGIVSLGGQSSDSMFIDFVQNKAQEIGEIFAEALLSSDIRQEELFDRNYKPIPNSDPQQFMAGCTRLTDSTLPPILESALELDPRVVFCAAVDINGYLPTHNQKFSQPQGSDPVWNAANCRNRRIFDDRVGLKAGQNLTPFLMQVYRRDMGGGEFAMMKDLSAPIYVNQRHWGGLRLAFKI